jgi:hypothetical protein
VAVLEPVEVVITSDRAGAGIRTGIGIDAGAELKMELAQMYLA